VKRELERVEIPGEYDARRRTWEVVLAAYREREPVAWPRRHVRALALAAAAAAVVAAAVTPPGRSVVNTLRDAVGRERVVGVRHAERELVRLPSAGRLLVVSPRGAWVVHRDGSRRLLGPYRDASWSPHGLFVAGVLRDRELVALKPDGTVRWEKPRRQRLASPRWSYEGYRIAYLAGRTLRVIWGNGEYDRLVGAADPAVAPAWKPGTHTVAWVGADGAVRVADVDAAEPARRLRVRGRVVALGWQNGRVVAVAAAHGVAAAAFDPASARVARVVRTPTRSRVLVGRAPVFSGAGRIDSVAFAPDGRWLAIGWPSADQLVFVRLGRGPRLEAVSDVARQFDPGARAPRFPELAGWSR
jgi:hypothetical protein